MRWCVAAGVFPPAIGGPATHAWDLAHELRRRGEAATVVALGCTPTTEGSPESGARGTTPFPVVTIPLSVPRVPRLAKMAAAVATAARRADVIYATGGAWDVGLSAALASRLSRRPWIMRVSGDTAWERARNQGATSDSLDQFQSRRYARRIEIWRTLQRWVARDADAVVAPSRYLASIIAGWGVRADRIHVVHSGVDLFTFHGEDARHAQEGVSLVTIARFVNWKRLDHLLTMLSQLPDAVRLTVIGSGPQQPRLVAQAASLGLHGRVIFAGALDRAALRTELHAASLFVLNSEYEGLSHSLLEAMACGMAVVATDAGGTPEVIEHGVDGVLVGVDQPGELLKQISALLQDSERRRQLGSAAQHKARRFSMDSMVDHIQRVGSSVVMRAEPR